MQMTLIRVAWGTPVAAAAAAAPALVHCPFDIFLFPFVRSLFICKWPKLWRKKKQTGEWWRNGNRELKRLLSIPFPSGVWCVALVVAADGARESFGFHLSFSIYFAVNGKQREREWLLLLLLLLQSSSSSSSVGKQITEWEMCLSLFFTARRIETGRFGCVVLCCSSLPLSILSRLSILLFTFAPFTLICTAALQHRN